MGGGGARRGTLVIHYGTGHRRPAPRARQPRDEPRSCVSQPAHQSLLDRRLSCRPLPCAIIGRTSCFRTDRERTPMPPTIESGHESGSRGFPSVRPPRPCAILVSDGWVVSTSSLLVSVGGRLRPR